LIESDIYYELKALHSKAFNLSSNDKDRIKQISKDYNIGFVERSAGCTNCYVDQIIILMIAMKKKLLPFENKNCDFIVVDNVDVTILGHRVNNETITNDVANFIIANFRHHKKYIKKK